MTALPGHPPDRAAPAGEPQGVRALLWLKSRELLGETRDPARLVLIGAGVACWILLVGVGCVQADRSNQIAADVGLAVAAGAAWPLWAIVPLLGGGGGELVAAHRLAPYPVSARAVFGGTWLTALTDVPYLVVLPLVLGFAVAEAGLLGLLLALVFVAGCSATGQLVAWLSYLSLAGRRRTALAALLLTGCVVGALAALPYLLPAVDDIGDVLPGGWVSHAVDALRLGRYASYAGWVAALAVPVPVALLVGPRLARAALDREAGSSGVGARPWGEQTWFTQGSVRRALVVTNLRSVGRAVGAQVAIAGVLAVPTLTRFPGVDFVEVPVMAMGGIAGLAASTVLGINSFAFDGGGASVLLSWPVPARAVLVAKATAVFAALLLTQVTVTVLGAAVLATSGGETAVALVLAVARTAGLTGLAMVWSVRAPTPSDYDSLRARISTPGAIMGFCTAAGFVSLGVSQTARLVPGAAGVLTSLVFFTALGWVAFEYAVSVFDTRAGVERVAAGVQG
ncbi:MAG TPA: hypothetical protein VNB94_06890 [Mycobacteriales bacterium]|nr:hypothetical protein [Mycobacteriales bacterium]